MDLLEGRDGHGRQVEVRRLSHVEAPRPGRELVSILDQTGEVLGCGAGRPAVLERLAVLMVRMHVEKAERVRTHQPLVARRRRIGGPHALEVDGQGADGLGEVERERAPCLAHALTDDVEIEERSVRPAAVRQRRDGGALVDCVEHRPGQVAVRGIDGAHLGPGAGRRRPPRIDVGGKLLCEQDDGPTGAERQVPRRCGHAVARGRDDRDVTGAGVDDARIEVTRVVDLGEEVGSGNLPRSRLAAHAPIPRLDDRMHERRHVGAVEIRDVVRQVEEVALARDHRCTAPCSQPGTLPARTMIRNGAGGNP